MKDQVRQSLLSTLAFHDTWEHAPTLPEWIATADCSGVEEPSLEISDFASAISELECEGSVVLRYGRYAFPEHGLELIERIRDNEIWNSRKLRVAKKVAKWLARLSPVRFIAVCNTIALGHARDHGDIDFFVITKRGTIMTTRGIATLPFKLLGRRPRGNDDRDAVCLSYFVTDDGLELSSHMLTDDDPYFRYWLLSLLPLYDDGISEDFWNANSAITSRHPFARKWIVPPDVAVTRPSIRLPIRSFVESFASGMQIRAFPSAIRNLMNKDTRVIVTPQALKFHVDDRREEYRNKHEDICHTKNISVPKPTKMTDRYNSMGFEKMKSIKPMIGWKNIQELAFQIFWRLAIIVLPWQTRWFFDASVAGWPWEQGRMSLYVSWFFILATIVIRPPTKMVRSDHFRGCRILFLAILVFLSVFAAAFDVSALRAISQWWIQVTLLFIFGLTLFNSGIIFRKLATWFVISLVPHVALGFWQYAIQLVIGHSWLGMAAQLPENLGVSVVEHGEYRLLRMYGGFPHPNIFGGWLAIGFVCSLQLVGFAKTKWRALSWTFCCAALSIALLLTYARGAWIAVIVGVVIVGAGLVPALSDRTGARPAPTRQFIWLAILVSTLATGIVGYSQRDHILSRFDATQRLEAKSIQTRSVSLKSGIEIFMRHPFFGTGPNAELLDLAKQSQEKKSVAPLEPPHNAFLLVLVDFGIFGFLIFVWILWLNRRFVIRHSSFVIPLLVLALFDYYPWSFWAGQSLVMLVMLLREDPLDGFS
jgi:hypothetical protein